LALRTEAAANKGKKQNYHPHNFVHCTDTRVINDSLVSLRFNEHIKQEDTMDRLRVWIESDRHGITKGAGRDACLIRPPPLRTSDTYDDEDAFKNVSLNLLSRYEALELSASETIRATIISPQERLSFHEALCNRKSRALHVSPSNVSLVERVDKIFGNDLLNMIREDTGGEDTRSLGKRQFGCPPMTPRENSTSSGSEYRNDVFEKITRRRRFFPDSDSKSGGFFRSRRVKNFDWSLADAVSQVQSLRLDGSQDTPKGDSTYQPPSLVSKEMV
jgi:hypothetical protein